MKSESEVRITEEADGSLRVSQPSPVSTRLYGLPLLLVGLCLALVTIAGVVSLALPGGDKLSWGSILGVLITLILAAVFLVPGVYLSLHSQSHCLNLAQGIVTTRESFFFWKTETRYVLSANREVKLSSELITTHSRTGRGASPLHSVALVTAEGDSVTIATFWGEEKATELAEQLSAHFGTEIDDRLGELDADPEQ